MSADYVNLNQFNLRVKKIIFTFGTQFEVLFPNANIFQFQVTSYDSTRLHKLSCGS